MFPKLEKWNLYSIEILIQVCCILNNTFLRFSRELQKHIVEFLSVSVFEQGSVILVQVFHVIYFLWIMFNNLKYITFYCYYPNLRYESMTKEWFI